MNDRIEARQIVLMQIANIGCDGFDVRHLSVKRASLIEIGVQPDHLVTFLLQHGYQDRADVPPRSRDQNFHFYSFQTRQGALPEFQ